MTSSYFDPSKMTTSRGLIRTIVLIVIALFILAYFGFNLRSIADSPTFKDNWSLIWGFIVNVWTNYLQAPATAIWNVFISYIWQPALDHLQHAATSTP